MICSSPTILAVFSFFLPSPYLPCQYSTELPQVVLLTQSLQMPLWTLGIILTSIISRAVAFSERRAFMCLTQRLHCASSQKCLARAPRPFVGVRLLLGGIIAKGLVQFKLSLRVACVFSLRIQFMTRNLIFWSWFFFSLNCVRFLYMTDFQDLHSFTWLEKNFSSASSFWCWPILAKKSKASSHAWWSLLLYSKLVCATLACQVKSSVPACYLSVL